VIHLAGTSVAGRWTDEKKHLIRETRVTGTRHLVDAMRRSGRPPRTLIAASASGYYGDRQDEPLVESDGAGDDFLAGVCRAWEAEAEGAAQLGARVVRLRQGIVLGSGGGALQAMAPIFRWGAGGPLGSGRQWWPWIHIDDLVALFLFALDRDQVAGAVNAVSPDIATNARFAHAFGHALRRPALMPAPALALRLALGEFSQSLLSSQLMLPAYAQDHGFVWRHESLEQAVLSICGSSGEPVVARREFDAFASAPPQRVFDFFSRPENLASLVPSRMRFKLTTPLPIAMRRGAVIEYGLRVRGVPIRWKIVITDFREGHAFTDVQLRGPYELWRHRHEFEPSSGGVQMRDRLEFSLPLAPLSNVALPMVKADVVKIFAYRQTRIAELLSGDRF
ncbi:MAG: TIGR01777 family oxidoreductase, partial [Candidatus Eremiobacteraeota bacterium]|nr:TIGR01777 family oxidoreductase [Candidatus Eremiobacteraeota bacterium]